MSTSTTNYDFATVAEATAEIQSMFNMDTREGQREASHLLLEAKIRERDEEMDAPNRYRIERRDGEGPTWYWNRSRGNWQKDKWMATVYLESERSEFLQRELKGETNKFPSGGCWVRLEAEREAA